MKDQHENPLGLEGFEFAEHTDEVLPELQLTSEAELEEGWQQTGYLRLRYDRKKYKRAARAERDGFHFVEDEYSWQLRGTSLYHTELLAAACQAFMGESQPQGPAVLELALSHDGMPVYASLQADEFTPEQRETIESLVRFFTWGYPAHLERGEQPDTLRLPLDFPLVPADSTALDELLRGVRY